jgi:hypothetical protein
MYIPLLSCHYDNIKIARIITDGILTSATGYKVVLLLHYYNLSSMNKKTKNLNGLSSPANSDQATAACRCS